MSDVPSWLRQIPVERGSYFAGFVDGEGSFNVSLRKREDHTMKWQVVLTFNVSQKERYILELFKRYLGCGKIRVRRDGITYFHVNNPRAIIERVIPFFERFQFLSHTKKRNFAIFKEITKLVEQKKHLTSEGLEEIIQLREKLNEGHGRKRKYNWSDYKESLGENPQRLYAKPRAFREEA